LSVWKILVRCKKFTRKYGSFERLSVLKVYLTYYHLNILHVGVFQIDVKGNSRKVSDVVVVIQYILYFRRNYLKAFFLSFFLSFLLFVSFSLSDFLL